MALQPRFQQPTAADDGKLWRYDHTDGRSVLYDAASVGIPDAAGDGVTDDTAAVAAALAADLTVYFPAGTYLVTGLTLRHGAVLYGDGSERSIIKLKAASNTDLLQGEDWASLNGTFVSGANTTAGHWQLRGLCLDGNYSQQTSGTSYCLRAWGRATKVHDVWFRHGYTDCVWHEGNGGGIAMESQWSSYKIEEGGLRWRGPSDSFHSNATIFRSRNRAYAAGRTGVYVDGSGGGALFTDVHVWGEYDYLWHDTVSNVQHTNCVADGGYLGGVVFDANHSSWLGGTIYGDRGRGKETGTISSVGAAGVILGIGASEINSCLVQTVMRNYAGAELQWTADLSGTSATLTSGTWPTHLADSHVFGTGVTVGTTITAVNGAVATLSQSATTGSSIVLRVVNNSSLMGRLETSVGLTNASTTASKTAGFTTADIGKAFVHTDVPFGTYISNVAANGNSCTLSAAATNTATVSAVISPQNAWLKAGGTNAPGPGIYQMTGQSTAFSAEDAAMPTLIAGENDFSAAHVRLLTNEVAKCVVNEPTTPVYSGATRVTFNAPFTVNATSGQAFYLKDASGTPVTSINTSSPKLELVSGADLVAWSGSYSGQTFLLDGATGRMTVAGYVDLAEQSAPSAPAADNARLFARDNGSGKSQLVVRFPTGAVQVIATEP